MSLLFGSDITRESAAIIGMYQNDIHFAAFTNDPRYLISEIMRNISVDYFHGYMPSCGVGLKYY